MADEVKRKRPDESMLASATTDRTPHAGIVLSSFKSGSEHDGTTIPGLTTPRPVDAVLTDAEQNALLRHAIGLSRGGRRGGVGPIGPEDWVVLKIVVTPELCTDTNLLRGVLEMMIAARQGKRFTIAEDADPPASIARLVADLQTRHRVEYVNLATAPYLTAPAVRRTFAARNPQSIYAIPKVIRECDRIITISPLRTSPLTGVALSASSYWSFAPKACYGQQREKLMALGDPVDLLTDLYLHHPPDFAILGGPLHLDGAGNRIRHNIVIAGRSALAVDSVGAAVMGFKSTKIPLHDKLEARGFGVCDPDSVWTHGNEIESAQHPFSKPAGWSTL